MQELPLAGKCGEHEHVLALPVERIDEQGAVCGGIRRYLYGGDAAQEVGRDIPHRAALCQLGGACEVALRRTRGLCLGGCGQGPPREGALASRGGAGGGVLGGALAAFACALGVDGAVEVFYELVPRVLTLGMEAAGVRLAAVLREGPFDGALAGVRIVQAPGEGAGGRIVRREADAAKLLDEVAEVHELRFWEFREPEARLALTL